MTDADIMGCVVSIDRRNQAGAKQERFDDRKEVATAGRYRGCFHPPELERWRF